MEEIYENEEFDKLMDKYNFDSPIQVTLVIEDEELPEPVFLRDQPVLSPNIQNNYVCAKNKMSTTKKNFVEETNHSNPVNKTAFPEGHQENIEDNQWQLLDAIAENLIQITKYHYYNFDSIRAQTENYERLKFEYVSFKHHIFYSSFNTTVALLLPRENDILFRNDFIHRVIAISYSMSWFKISYEILDILIRELFTWTKQEKKNLDMRLCSRNHEKGGMDWFSRALMISNRINHSRQVLNRPFENCPTTNNTTQFIPKTHLPVQKNNISPNIRHISNYSAQEETGLNISPRINYPIQDIFNQNTVGPIKKNAAPKKSNKFHKNCSENSRIYNSTQIISRLPYNGLRINDSSMTSNYNNEPETNNFGSCQATKTNTSKILLSTGPPNQEITISVDTNILANLNFQNTKQINSNAIECCNNKSHEAKSIKRQKPKESSHHPYSNLNRVPYHNANNLNNKNNNCCATTSKSSFNDPLYEDARKAENEMFMTDTLRSSISRDSGFASPVYGSTRNDQTIETPTSEERDTPIISHVTSMNPNAVHLNFGFCKVCRTTTKNVCIGCYKEYYCSYSCQTKDWENHKYICSE